MGDVAAGLAWAVALAILVFGQPARAPAPAAAPVSYCHSGQAAPMRPGEGRDPWLFAPCRDVDRQTST